MIVSDLLRPTGAVTAEVDGEPRSITAENVVDEIERERCLQKAGLRPEDTHKAVLAVNFSDTTATKASQRVHAHLRLTFQPPVDGRHAGTLHADLEHTGTNSEDSFYTGYLHWWAKVVLPDGSSRVSSDPAPAPRRPIRRHRTVAGTSWSCIPNRPSI